MTLAMPLFVFPAHGFVCHLLGDYLFGALYVFFGGSFHILYGALDFAFDLVQSLFLFLIAYFYQVALFGDGDLLRVVLKNRNIKSDTDIFTHPVFELLAERSVLYGVSSDCLAVTGRDTAAE